MVMYVCNPSKWEAGEGVLWVWGQHGLHEKLVKERKTAQHYQFKEIRIRISVTDHFIQTRIVVIHFSEVENNNVGMI